MGKCQCKHSNNTRRKYKQMWRLKKSINLSEALASTSPLAEQQGRRQRGVVLVEKGCAIGWWRRRLGISARHCRLRFFITAAVVVAAFVSKFKVAKVQFTFYPLYIAVLACKWFSLNKLFRFLCTVKSCCLFFARPLEFVVVCLFVGSSLWPFAALPVSGFCVCFWGISPISIRFRLVGSSNEVQLIAERALDSESETEVEPLPASQWLSGQRCVACESRLGLLLPSTRRVIGYQSYFCSFCGLQ